MTGPRSLRLRLLLGTCAATAVVLALLGLSIYLAAWHSLLGQFDDALLTKARAIASMVEQQGARVTFDFNPQDMPEFLPAKRPEYFEVWLDDGSVLARSASLATRDLSHPAATAQSVWATRLPDGHGGRALALPIVARRDPDDQANDSPPPALRKALVVVARSDRPIEDTLEWLGWLLLIFCGGAVVLCGVAMLWVVRRGLAPVARLAGDIDSLRAADLSRRLPAQDMPTELVPIVEELNRLLDRLAAAFGRERAFTADAAHELRTPLAALRTTLEVCRSRPREPAAYVTAIDKCSALAERMEATTGSLLMLARAEAGQLRPIIMTVDLSAMLTECWVLVEDRAKSRGLTVQWTVPPECLVRSDADKLRIIVQNLFDNVASHADEHGQVRVTARGEAGSVFLAIANTAKGAAAQDVERVFDRFWRADTSRTDTATHSGLGLSLCRRLMDLLGGQISASVTDAGEFQITLQLPVA